MLQITWFSFLCKFGHFLTVPGTILHLSNVVSDRFEQESFASQGFWATFKESKLKKVCQIL